MQNCNICLEEQIPHNQLIQWHPKTAVTHRTHESCVDCVALQIFTHKQQMQPISCPDCRKITEFKPVNFSFSGAYTFEKVAIFSLTYFSARYLISPVISAILSKVFLSEIDNHAIRWSQYGEPPISWLHPTHSQEYLNLTETIRKYVENDHISTILGAIDTHFNIQKLITQTLIYIASIKNISSMYSGADKVENAQGMALQVLHLIFTRFLLSYCDVTAEDVTSDFDGHFSTVSYPPASNPRLLAKTITEVSLGLLIFAGFTALYVFRKKPDEQIQEPATVQEIKAALLDKSYALKPAAHNHHAF